MMWATITSARPSTSSWIAVTRGHAYPHWLHEFPMMTVGVGK